MSTTTVPVASMATTRSPWASARIAFGALLLRDLVVLRRRLKEFIPRTVLQPFLLVFVFTYVFPKIGQGVGGHGATSSSFSTLLIAGVVGFSILMQGMMAVALPMVDEFGFTREIEDRVQAPLPVSMVALAKIATGAFNCFFAAAIVFPIAAIVPATPVHLTIDWPVLLTLVPLACYASAALGLTFGTRFEPRTVPMLFGIVMIPVVFLGAMYYTWAALEPIKWLKVFVLFNPLVYINEGFRAALTNVPHMSLWVVYLVLTGFSIVFTWLGINGFKKRVLS